MIAPNTLIKCMLDAVRHTLDHDGVEHAGYLAFLGMLSFFPFLIFFGALAGFFGEKQVAAEFLLLLDSYLPADFIAALKPRIVEIISGPPQGLLTVAIIGVIWTASSAVEGVRTVLNRAYHVTTPPSFLWRRMMSIAQFLLFTFAIIIAMLMLVIVPVFIKKIQIHFGLHIEVENAWNNLRLVFAAGIIFLVVAATYVVLPNIKQRIISVIPGTVMVMALWMLSAHLLSLYLSTFSQLNLVYGSLGGIIISMLFFFMLALVYIFGAELNYKIEIAQGHRIIEKQKSKKGKNHER